MATDIAPELYNQIKESFDRKYSQAQMLGGSLKDIADNINAGTATYRDADMYAVEVGTMMAESMKEALQLDALPNARLFRNIAQRTIGEGLKDTYGIMSNITSVIQEEFNEQRGIGLRPARPKLETERIDNIVNRASEATTQEALEATITDSVPTFARQVVDDSQKANARQHHRSGLSVKVEREYDGVGLHDGTDACEWCIERAGTWDYQKALDNGVFERHEGCGCIITYTSAKGEVTVGESKYSGWRVVDPKALEQSVLDRIGS